MAAAREGPGVRKIAFGIGDSEAADPRERGAVAARLALERVGALPPALAVLTGGDHENAAEVVQGVRGILGSCPVVGMFTSTVLRRHGDGPGAPARVRLLASPHLWAKVGLGPGEPGSRLEDEAAEAFRTSRIGRPAPGHGDESPEDRVFRWYSYRRPSVALTLVRSDEGERRERVEGVAAFLRKRLQGRVPYLVVPCGRADGECVLVADERVAPRGVLMVTVRTDLQLRLERFHEYEPTGERLFVTGSAGRRVLELNGRGAMDAYLEAVGLRGDELARDGEGALFSLFPPGVRVRGGRFMLLRQARFGADGALELPVSAEDVQVIFPMRPVSSFEVAQAAQGRSGWLPLDPAEMAGTLLLRNVALRDHVLVEGGERIGRGEGVLEEVPAPPETIACLGPGEGEGEEGGGHLLLALGAQFEGVAMAARENERLLREVMHFKRLNQRIFDGIGHGVALVGEGRRVLHCNETYRRIMGADLGQALGACPLAAAGSACPECVVERVLRGGEFATQDVSVEADGGKRWLRVDAFPLAGESGRGPTVVEVIRDVTDFKLLGESLASEQRKTRAVIQGIAEAVYIVGPSYELQYLHRGQFPFPETAPAAGSARRTCHEVLFGRAAPCKGCRLAETVSGARVTRRVVELAREGQPERFFQVTLSPWSGEPGEPAAAIGLVVDISTQRRMERQLLRSEKLNSLSILTAGVAHELNNPLGAMSFNLEVLDRRGGGREQREILESMKRDLARIARIVGNLQSFSRGGGAPAVGWVQPGDVVDSALELFQASMERKRITVERAYDRGARAIWGNPHALQQVFVNLISNAIDAMPGGGRISIEVGPREAGALVPGSVAVVYDHPGDLPALRTLLDLPGLRAEFFRGADEMIAAFQRGQCVAPDVLLLDLLDPLADETTFFLGMVREFAPAARLLVVTGEGRPVSGGDLQGGGADTLERPFSPDELQAAIRGKLGGTSTGAAGQPGTRVRFSDSGNGIPRELRDRVFDPFFTTKDNKGTGLGLSVVHKILSDHEATVRVDSATGRGTTFVIDFPPASAEVVPGAMGPGRQGEQTRAAG